MINLYVAEIFKLENKVNEVVFKENQCDSNLQVDVREREREWERKGDSGRKETLTTIRALQPNPETKGYWFDMGSWQWGWQGRDSLKHSDFVISVVGISSCYPGKLKPSRYSLN